MFTGIVEEVGTVDSLHYNRLAVRATTVIADMISGDSIAVNGVCLTVTDIKNNSFVVDVMPETLRRTNLGLLHTGDKVNLERAMAANGRFGGHFVQGHIDGTGRVVSMTPEGAAVLMRIESVSDIMRYIVEKGFIAVDGVSLTIVNHGERSFVVSLVGFTRDHTILGIVQSGTTVNLEVDIIAKYVERMTGRSSNGITVDYLQSKGF